MSQTQVRQIRISVDTKGNQELKALAAQFGGMNKSIKTLSGSMGFLKNTFISYFAALQIGELIRMSDSMQLLRDRIAVMTGSTESARDVMGELAVRADRTKSSIEDLAGIFARLSATTKTLGVSTSTVLNLTEVLANTFRLSGSGAQEANSAAIQLSQGFASGQLRGQELRSVLEANVVIGDILSKTFKVTRGELYKLAEAGSLTAGKVMVALLENMDSVNKQAEKLGATIEQSLTTAINKLKLKILDLNESLGVSGAVAKGIKVVTDRFEVLAISVSIMALSLLPALAGALATVAGFLGLLNPISAVVIAIGTGMALLFPTLKDLTDTFRVFAAVLSEILALFVDLGAAIVKSRTLFGTNGGALGKFLNEQSKALRDYAEIQATIVQRSTSDALTDAKKAEDAFFSGRTAVSKDLNKLKNAKPVDKKPKEVLAELNKEFIAGKISAEQYFQQFDSYEILKVVTSFKEGKIELGKFNEELLKFAQGNLTREFNNSRISLEEFNNGVEALKIQDLNNKFKQGTITLREYNTELVKITQGFDFFVSLRAGATSFIDSIGTVGTNVADAIKNAFSSLEDAFVSFVQTGKFNFADLTKAVLDDLTRIIIRASIIRPLANAFLNFSPGASAGGSAGTGADVSGVAAKGMAFNNGIRKFANGGIVNSPTMFNYNKGKVGMMGEAGTEAILPLSRGPGGNLGVQASVTPLTVNIINQNSSDVDQVERSGPNGERILDIMIRNRTRSLLADGSLDKSLQQNYGLTRKGT